MKIYHEIFGVGDPLILLHGGLMTIGEMTALIQPLASHRKVIAVELQGHGRTPDTDRPLSSDALSGDIADLIEDLELGQADVVGYSLGGHVALRTAILHPDCVRRLVVLSAPFARKGWYPEVQEGIAQTNSSLADALRETPVGIAAQNWPEPERFPQFLDKIGRLLSADYDWSAEVRRLKMPVMLIYADNSPMPG